ncbi:KSR2 Kinase, partial [Acrocephalus arundinaceus]|nr:KSR2 Kinase [Acrocephalus arundinaceus]
SVLSPGGSLSKQDWTIQWPSTEPGKENSPGCPPEPGPWGRTHLSPKVQSKCGQHHCHAGSSHGPMYTHVDRLTVEGHPGLCPPLESGHRSLPPSPRQRHAAHTPPRTPNIVTTMTPPGTPPVRRRNKLKPPGTPPPSSRKLIHLIPGFTALHRSKSHEFQLGHRVDEAHTPKVWGSLRASPPTPGGWNPQKNEIGKLQVLFSMQDTPRHPSWETAGIHRDGSGDSGVVTAKAAPPSPSPPRRAGATQERRWLSQLPVTPGERGGSAPLPCRLSGTRRRWLSPSARLVSLFAALLLAQLIPSSAAVDFGMSRAARSRSPDLCWSGEGKHGGVGRRVALPGTAVTGQCHHIGKRGLAFGNPSGGRSGMENRGKSPWGCPVAGVGSVGFFSHNFIVPDALCPLQNEEGAEEVQESEDDFEEMNLSLLSARNFPRKASQTSIFLQEWDIPFEQLEIGELIGKGRFGQVFHGRWHGEVAIRLIDIERDNEDQLKAFKREVMAYRQTRHENVVLFMGACMSPPHLAIITSLCKGRTLYSVVRDAKIVLDVNKTRQIAQEIVKGMGYLHAKGILHKDLKSKNVFYDNGKVVITDFGLFSISGVLQAGRRENKLRIQNGWLCHLAPEIIRQLSPDTEEDKLPFSKHSDVFALGTIWYELHAREWPFKTQPAEAIIWQVGRGMKPNLSQIGMGKEISDILLFCWAYEQEERPTFTKLMDMLEKLPKRNRRLSHPGHFWKSAE